ncbi:MAG TPA: GNAT family N-acetyltransferase [Thermoanaerobaculia bacterium]|nr:GNAT family N-acetyltransferase [Thermoanaerobaculia bacterium]
MTNSPPIEIVTERLRLRQWRESDLEPFARLNADPEVMEFFPSTLEAEASHALARRWQAQIADRGWSFWATEILSSGQFIGFIGLQIPLAPLPFSPCVEIGWRLAREHWGKGYATEGARAALRVGFEQLQLAEIVSFTTIRNARSRAVMERLHMIRSEETFEHPSVPEGNPLREHCLYRLTREQWREGT